VGRTFAWLSPNLKSGDLSTSIPLWTRHCVCLFSLLSSFCYAGFVCGGKRNASVWRPSVCSIYFPTLIGCAVQTHRDLPRRSRRRGQRTFLSETYYDDGHILVVVMTGEFCMRMLGAGSVEQWQGGAVLLLDGRLCLRSCNVLQAMLRAGRKHRLQRRDQ